MDFILPGPRLAVFVSYHHCHSEMFCCPFVLRGWGTSTGDAGKPDLDKLKEGTLVPVQFSRNALYRSPVILEVVARDVAKPTSGKVKARWLTPTCCPKTRFQLVCFLTLGLAKHSRRCQETVAIAREECSLVRFGGRPGWSP